tara:strand:- start:383 stop:577 length:195 start_codon:yes stop_codon:yes gene_type:complete
MTKRYSRRREASDLLGITKTPRRIKKQTTRLKKANRKQLLNIGSNVKYPKWFREDAKKGARRLK